MYVMSGCLSVFFFFAFISEENRQQLHPKEYIIYMSNQLSCLKTKQINVKRCGRQKTTVVVSNDLFILRLISWLLSKKGRNVCLFVWIRRTISNIKVDIYWV